MINQEELDLCKRLQSIFEKKMGAWKGMDWCYCSKCGVSPWHTLCHERYNRELLRLPLPIDPRNPERGLWGMLDWKFVSIPDVLPNGRVEIALWEGVSNQECVKRMEGETPTLALLRALAVQEGV